MRYTKDGLSVNKTERDAQLSRGIKKIMEQGGIIEPPKKSPKTSNTKTKNIAIIILAITILFFGIKFTADSRKDKDCLAWYESHLRDPNYYVTKQQYDQCVERGFLFLGVPIK